MRYFLYGAVLFFLGCGSTPCALSEPLSDSGISCRECIATLTAAARPNPVEKSQATPTISRGWHFQTDHQATERTQAGFFTFASAPACIGPCKSGATALGSDLLSDPAEDLYSWGFPKKVEFPGGAFLGRQQLNQPTPGMSTFWQDPSQEDYYWKIGALAFSGAETDFRTLTAGIKWVIPLQ